MPDDKNEKQNRESVAEAPSVEKPWVVTWEWWGWPKYGWIFSLYKTALGGRCLVVGVGSLTWRKTR